jgi:hypothetical protein
MALEYPSYADKAIFVDLLAEGSKDTDPASVQHLDLWIEDREIPFTAAIDPPGVGQSIVNDFSPRENTFLIELATMKISQHEQAPSMLYPALDAL